MVSFITANFANGHYNITVDGLGEGAQKKAIGAEYVVTLSAAKEEVCGFHWVAIADKISQVQIKNMVIYSESDINCLGWFIRKGIKVDLSKANISPDALEKLDELCENYTRLNIQVKPGSTISLPVYADFWGSDRVNRTKNKCQAIGFTVI